MKLNLIVALDSKHGFSKDNKIPWIDKPFAKEDLRHFRNLTMGHTCIMGRKTYEDISKFTGNIDILPGRECVVLSRDENYYISHDTLVYDNLSHAIGTVNRMKDIYIIGGGSLFKEALKWKLDNVYITMIDEEYKCDKFFPFEDFITEYKIDTSWRSKEYPIVKYNKFIKYDKKNFV